MKGIILAGGNGTRLHPLTKITNKCLLPIYDKPMIYYPIQTMVNSGIDDILLVCGGNAAGEFLRILGNGEQFGLNRLNYAYQQEPNGIAAALSLGRNWAGDEPICVMLSDNILQYPFKEHVKNYKEPGAKIFITEVKNPEWYGVAQLDNNKVINIEEKPKKPKSNMAVIGLYIYDSHVWDYIDNLEPSKRGELEITDVNNLYLQDNKLTAHRIHGWWADAGESIEAYMQANKVVWKQGIKNDITDRI